MDLDRLESVIGQIRATAIDKIAAPPTGFADRIASIKKAFQDFWQKEHLPQAFRITEAIRKGIPTPVLTVCGRGTQEIRFTRYLAYYLDPQKNHGLDDRLLKSVFSEEARIAGLPEDWTDACIVIPEFWLGHYQSKSTRKTGCFCDIGITGNDFVFVIEQKILSGEGPASHTGLPQLRRYDQVIENNPAFKDKVIIKIYLTPSGGQRDDWNPVSHRQIIEGAYKCLNDINISTTARENLRRLLIDLVLGPYTETEELISDIKEAADHLTGDLVGLQEVVKFRRLVENNRLLVNLLTEGSP